MMKARKLEIEGKTMGKPWENHGKTMGKQHVKKRMLIGCEVKYELGSVEF